MRQLALAIAAVLMLALVAPAFAQPFADVPADHWAFDAIAELAAKGILEGFPDGTFKGDRAMTRYEMAMALARILARIEAIKIPPPPKIPPPEVRRADIDRLQRLINEFRAELSALGVRITAVEEQLNAIKARLDNTRVTGDFRFRFNYFPSTTPAGVGGSATDRAPDYRMRGRLTFTGQVSPDVRRRHEHRRPVRQRLDLQRSLLRSPLPGHHHPLRRHRLAVAGRPPADHAGWDLPRCGRRRPPVRRGELRLPYRRQ